MAQIAELIFSQNPGSWVLFFFAYLDQPFMTTKHINFGFFNGFFHFKFVFCLTPTLTLLPWPEICNFLSRLSAKFQLLSQDIFIQTD